MGLEALTGISVLVVEDSKTQALQLAAALEDQQLKVTLVGNGLEGLRQMEKELPDIVIADIEMPVMNGYTFCRSVKSDVKLKSTPVILLTNLSDASDVIKGIECGADSFMTKPHDIALLLRNIFDLLANKKMRAENREQQSLELSFGGKYHVLQANQAQLVELLLSTYASAIKKNLELELSYRQLNLMHQELENKNMVLKQLIEQKNQFLGMAAHDLRNPLRIIEGYCQILIDTLQSKLDPAALKMLAHIQRTSMTMLQLVNELLDISAIESGKIKLRLEPIDIIALISAIVSLEEMQAQKKNISITFVNKAETNAPKVLCDEGKISQVLNNLISNALKFSYPNSIVTLDVHFSQKEAIISISDQGIGIVPEEKERIFQPFMRGSGKTTAGESSTGLGLAIVHRIVEAHQGRIWLESEPQKGSTFFVSLPLAP